MVDRCMRNSSPREAERKKENEKNNWCGRNRNFKAKALVGEVGENGNLSIVGMASVPTMVCAKERL